MKKGFTLIELAIVMVVIGLLAGGSIGMMNILSKRAKITEAKQQLASIKEAIIGYAQIKGHLPASLGDLNLSNTLNPWNKPVMYRGDQNLISNLCAQTAISTTSGDYPSTEVAFILVSSGANHNMQTLLDVDTKLYLPGTSNIDYDVTDIGGTRLEEYDDLFTVMSKQEIQTILDCQSKRLQIINPTLPTGTVNTLYPTSSIIVTGNTGAVSYSPILNCPSGMSCSGGIIKDTPTASGSYPLTFIATDSIGNSASKQLVLVINADPNIGATGTGTNPARQACLDTCDAAGGNNGTITSCKAQCPK